ncbi:MAG: hypothetical protein ACTHZ7_14860 [Sphingobacterium sp.]
MKTNILFSVLILLVSSCQNAQQQSDYQTDTSFDSLSGVPIGGNKDAHGCLTASGETWSQMRNSCVQLFNVALRLNPTSAREGNAQFSAFALFDETDSARVELFLPHGQEQSEVIDRSPNGHFESGAYTLKIENPTTLYINGKKEYQQDAD